jgi:hypothetical protein
MVSKCSLKVRQSSRLTSRCLLILCASRPGRPPRVPRGSGQANRHAKRQRGSRPPLGHHRPREAALRRSGGGKDRLGRCGGHSSSRASTTASMQHSTASRLLIARSRSRPFLFPLVSLTLCLQDKADYVGYYKNLLPTDNVGTDKTRCSRMHRPMSMCLSVVEYV